MCLVVYTSTDPYSESDCDTTPTEPDDVIMRAPGIITEVNAISTVHHVEVLGTIYKVSYT